MDSQFVDMGPYLSFVVPKLERFAGGKCLVKLVFISVATEIVIWFIKGYCPTPHWKYHLIYAI